MKIISSKATFLSALSRIQGIIEKNSLKPITANALIEATDSGVYISATNLQIGMKAYYDDIEILENGKVSINARKLYEILKELPDGKISFYEKDNYRIEIACGKEIRFNVIGLPPEDFPMIVKEENDVMVSLEREKLVNMFEMTSFSISKDETKINICGAFIEKIENNRIRMVATDGYRLSIIDEQFSAPMVFNDGFIIPYKAVIELQKILEEKENEKKIDFFVKKNSIVLKIGNVEVFVRLIEKKFPDYKLIIPSDAYNKINVIIKKDSIKPALKRMSIISNEHNQPVLFTFNNNFINIKSEDTEFGVAEENIELEESVNKIFSFCINGSYLLDIINVIQTDIIIEFIEEENRPITVKKRSGGEDLKYIIMPMLMD